MRMREMGNEGMGNEGMGMEGLGMEGMGKKRDVNGRGRNWMGGIEAGGMGGRVEAPFKKSRLSLNNQLNKIN